MIPTKDQLRPCLIVAERMRAGYTGILLDPYESPSIAGIFDGRLWLLKKIQLVRSFVLLSQTTESDRTTRRQIEGQRVKGYKEGGS